MTKEEKRTLTPKLRFPEFRKRVSWGKKILGEEGDFLSSLTGKTSQHFGVGSAKYITYMNVFMNTFTDMSSLSIVDVGDNESQNLVESGDVLFTVSSETPEEVGMSSVVLETVQRCYLNSFCAMFRFTHGNRPDLRFLGYTLRQPFTRNHFSQRAQGSTRFNLSKSAFRSLPFALPLLDEQQKIADCLTSLDELIAAQGRKVEALKTYKKGLMQQLFPREGETVPRLRFPEFRKALEWESTTLEQLVDIQSGGTPSKANPNFWSGSIPWVSAKDMKKLFLDNAEDHISTAAIKDGARLVPAGTLLMLTRGMTLLKDVPICVLRREMSFNQDVKGLRPKDHVDGLFLAFLLLGNKPRLLRMVDVAGHGTGKLDTEELKALELVSPQPLEQQRIAGCLSALDVQIAAETDKLAALKTHKQGLMQQLFPTAEDE